MLRQWLLFKTALMFLTRIPVGNLPFSQITLQASARYFSWVGILVGLVGALVFGGMDYFFSTPLSIAISMLITILLTGSFHEDGLADCCDAFGGGWNKEKILTIMKDSRLGTYGVVGLISILALKFLFLLELSYYFNSTFIAIIIIAAHSSSRFFAVCVMQLLPYVQDIDSSKSKPLADRVLTKKEMLVLTIGMLIPMLLFYFPSTVYRLPPHMAGQASTVLFLPTVYGPPSTVLFLSIRYFKKWIGGYTGDCLGATQQICEISFYIGCLLLWKFI